MVLDEHISSAIGTKDVNPSMASLTNGSFVVTWKSLYSGPGYIYSVDVRLYDPSGASKEVGLGGSASYASRSQQYPSVTALKDGGFVVIWPSEGGIGSDIYGRRYDADGAPLGTEFHINAYYDYKHQTKSSVIALTDGGFLVLWTFGYGIYGQRYDASGIAQGSEFPVDSDRTIFLSDFSVAELATGGFVMVWGSGDLAGDGVYGQRYDVNGIVQGAEFRINPDTESGQSPLVTALTNGDFVVTWMSSDESGSGIYGQRYDVNGIAQGAEFRINPDTESGQSPSVTALTNGDFVVTWMSSDESGSGIYGQRFDAAGIPQDSEFLVNSYTYVEQNNPSVTALNDGGFVVTWESWGEDKFWSEIRGKRFDANGNEVEWIGAYNSEPEDPDGKTADEIFISVLSANEKLVTGAQEVGMIRVMADLSKAAYHLEEHEENSVINDKDPSGNADKALIEVKNQGWQPLNASELGLSSTLSESSFPYTVHEVLDNGFGATKVKNGLSNGFYTHDNAAAFVVRSGDSVVIAFRGTNDNSDDNSMDDGNKIHPDVDEWGSVLDGSAGDMTDHYYLLRPILDSIDAYIAVHDIKKVYVTGHSLGGAMAIEYMDNHPDTTVTYSAITFAAPSFTITNAGQKEYDDDERITQIEISEDPVPQTWDIDKVLNTYSNNRPGDAIRFAGNQTLTEPDFMKMFWANKENHSMDYYRKIVDNVDTSSWLKILNESGDQTVFLGGRQSGDNFLVDEGADVLKDTDLDQEDFDQLGDDDIEIFYGGRGNDTLTGGSSDELMLGGSGNDDIDGSKGIDTVAYSGARTNYSLQLNERLLFADQLIVTDQRTGVNNDGVDTLENIERLIFTDLGVAFDLDGNAGGVAKILGAIFGASSLSNKQFVGTGLKLLDNGMSFQDAIQLALNSKLGEGFSNADEVNLLYKNLLGVLPSIDDLNSWVGKLNSGELSQISLAELAINLDLNETNIDLIGLQQTGIEFV